MKTLHLLLAGAVSLLAIISCNEETVEPESEPEPEQGTEYDEAWYADNATISSSDAHFADTEEGWEISFKAEGGSVVVYVDCGAEWTADDSEAGVFGCDVQETCITVTADQNLVEEELHGTITLMTAESQIHFATISITQNAYGAPEIKVETYEWNIPAVAADPEEFTTEIGVEATEEWEAVTEAEWLTVEKGENSVALIAAENETTEERVAEVVLTCTDGYNSDSETITVTQDARAYITLSEEVFEVGAKGGTDTLTVESNYEWEYASESDWFTVAENGDGSLTVTVNANTVEEAREGVVTFTAGDGAANVAEATFAITQDAYSVPEIGVSTNEWKIPAVAADAGDLTTEIVVEATEEWSIECEADWLTAEKGENSVILIAAENETTEERVAEVVLTCTDGYNSDSETITVTQDARAYITLSDEEFEFDKKSGEATVTVESNYEWSYAYESDWFTVAENGDGSLTVTAGTNATGNDRAGTVTFTAGDGAANTAVATLTVTQETFDPASLVLEYTIDTGGTEIQLPIITDVGNFEIDWGDGEKETTSADWPSHTYSDVGTYDVAINGTILWMIGLNINLPPDDEELAGSKCLTAVKQWGDTGLSDMGQAFYEYSNLASLPDGPGPFENVWSFQLAFVRCESLKEVPEDMFKNCATCTLLGSVFADCTNLVAAPSFEGLSTVTDLSGVFDGCSSLTVVPENIFSGCTAVTSLSNVFAHCTSLTTVPAGLFDSCTKVTTFLFSFYNCTSLTIVPVGLFDNCPSVTTFQYCFSNCTSLTTVPVGLFDNCTKVTNFRYLFQNCTELVGESPYTEINVNGETVKVHLYERENYPDYFTAPTTYGECFSGCTKLDDYDDIPDSWK